MNSIVCYDYAGTQLKNLYQWDANQRILISGLDIGIATEIHFCHPDSTEALVSVPYAYGQYIAADIPNILLQKANPLVIYVFQDSINSGHRTIHSLRIPVYPRPKPADYVYTETEVLCYSKIDERLRALEEGGGSNSTGSESPVKSVNGKFGEVTLNAYDVGARPSTWTPTAAEVGALPITYTPPNQTAEQVGADPKGTAASVVSKHNTSTEAHNDLRIELKALSDRINVVLDSDDTTLDELSEIVAYIKSNKTLINGITTSKVNVTDIIDNMTTNVANKPLSAAQGVVLKGLIDGLSTGKLDASALTQAINTALAQAKASGEFDGKVKTVNGIEPDENGNVQIKIAVGGTPPIAPESVQSDLNQNDPTQPDYVNNRTHWEENNQTIIEWDGSTEGRDCATDESGMLEALGNAFYKVSDLILTKDDVIGGTICVIMESIPSELTLTEDMVVAGDGVVNISNILVVFTNTTAVLDGVTLEVPSVGCYAASLEQGLVRFESLTCGSNTIHKLDPKFLPEGGFGWEGNAPIVINWDGNITEEMQANSFQIYGPETMTITKFSDLAPTRDDLIGGTLTVNGGTVSITEEYYEGVFEERDNHTVLGNSVYIFYDTNYSYGSGQFTVPSTGTYVYIKDKTPKSIAYGSAPVIHKIDEKFIPDTIARTSELSQAVEDYMAEHPVQGGGSGASVQADLSQNDSTQPDYVKNRTHYKYQNSHGCVFSGAYEDIIYRDGTYRISDILIDGDPILGEKYSVYIDGAETRYASYELKEYASGIWYLGNLSILVPSADNTAEKFLMLISDDPRMTGRLRASIYASVEIGYNGHHDHNVYVYGPITDHSPLDERYIPDTIARVDAPMNSVTLVSPNGTKFCVMIDDSGKLIVSNMAGDIIEQSSGSLPDAEEAEF